MSNSNNLHVLNSENKMMLLDPVYYSNEDEFEKFIIQNLSLLDCISDFGTPVLLEDQHGISDSLNINTRWEADLLLCDRNAKPIVVEIKRKNDQRIKTKTTNNRREVIGQIWEYAANLKEFDDQAFKSMTENIIKKYGFDKKLYNETLYSLHAEKDFLEEFNKNILSKNITLCILTEDIDKELQVLLEYMNDTDPQTFIGLEIKQYIDDNKKLYSSKVYGYTQQQKILKLKNTSWSYNLFVDELSRNGFKSSVRIIKDIIDWGNNNNMQISYSKNTIEGKLYFQKYDVKLLTITTGNTIDFRFDTYEEKLKITNVELENHKANLQKIFNDDISFTKIYAQISNFEKYLKDEKVRLNFLNEILNIADS